MRQCRHPNASSSSAAVSRASDGDWTGNWKQNKSTRGGGSDYKKLISDPVAAQLAADFMVQTALLEQFVAVQGKYTELGREDDPDSSQDEY